MKENFDGIDTNEKNQLSLVLRKLKGFNDGCENSCTKSQMKKSELNKLFRKILNKRFVFIFVKPLFNLKSNYIHREYIYYNIIYLITSSTHNISP